MRTVVSVADKTRRQLIHELLLSHPQGVTTNDLLRVGGARYSARVKELKASGVPILSKPIRRNQYRYWIADLTPISKEVVEEIPTGLFNAEELKQPSKYMDVD